jgi:hypothetical protein
MTDTTQLLQTALSKMDELHHRMAAAEEREARERREAKARADAAAHLTSREHLLELDAVKRKYQARADDALSTWGIRAAPPLASESVDDYRWRLAKEVQMRLPKDHQWYGKKIGKLWNNGFEHVESEIYTDARSAGERPDSAPPGQLREVEKINPQNGQRFVEFIGSRSFIHDLKAPFRYVLGFRTPQGFLNTTGQFRR